MSPAAQRVAAGIGASLQKPANPVTKVLGYVLGAAVLFFIGWVVVHRINGNPAAPNPTPTVSAPASN